MSADVPETYNTLWVTDFFHGFPHFKLDFSRVNSTFDPENHHYIQALAFWAFVPVAACVLFWLIFLLYFIIRCCQKQDLSKQRPRTCSKVLTGILIVVGVGLVAYGFYENENAHRSVQDVKRAVVDANSTIMVASNRIETLDNLANDVSTRLSNALEEATLQIENETIRNEAVNLIKSIRKEATSARKFFDKVQVEDTDGDFDDAVSTADDAEYFRWMITIIIFCLYIFIFLLALIGLLLRSKGTLIVCAAIGIFWSLAIWSATGAYISVSVALGDLCSDPDTYFISLTEGSSSEVPVTAYIKCTDPAQPYQKEILSAQQAVSTAITNLDDTVKLAKPYHIAELDKYVVEMRNDLQYSVGNLSTLLNNVGICTTLHNYYVSAIDAGCDNTIGSSALLALLCCLIALTCTILIFSMSCVWRQYIKRKLRAEYVPVDDTDPFLPHPPPYESDYGTMGTSSPKPWSERGTLQHAGPSHPHDDDHMLMPTRHHQHHYPGDESPPPAYHPGQYVKQYVDTGPTPNSIRAPTDN